MALSCGKGWGIHTVGLPAYRAEPGAHAVKHMVSGTTHAYFYQGE